MCRYCTKGCNNLSDSICYPKRLVVSSFYNLANIQDCHLYHNFTVTLPSNIINVRVTLFTIIFTIIYGQLPSVTLYVIKSRMEYMKIDGQNHPTIKTGKERLFRISIAKFNESFLLICKFEKNQEIRRC